MSGSKSIADYANSRENGFDFLRFAAAGAVILSHSFPLSGTKWEPVAQLTGFQSLGALAVFVFFTLSGFLITKSWCDQPSVVDFTRKRAARILPGLLATSLFTVLIIGPLATTLSLSDYFTRSETWKYITNVFIVKLRSSVPGTFDGNPIPGANASLWTLRIEALVYVLTPVIASVGLLLARSRHLGLIALVAGVLAFDWHWVAPREKLNLIWFGAPVASTFFCLTYFLMGACYYAYRRAIVLNGKLALLALSLLVLSSYQANARLAYLVALPYLVFWIGYSVPLLAQFRRFGDPSYGMYIYAFPIQQLLVYRFPTINWVELFIASLVLSVALGYASWHLLESRCLRLARGRPKQPQLRIAA